MFLLFYVIYCIKNHLLLPILPLWFLLFAFLFVGLPIIIITKSIKKKRMQQNTAND